MKSNNKLRYIKLKTKGFDIKFNDFNLITINENNNSDLVIDAIFDKKRVKRTIDISKENNLSKILNEMKKMSKIKEQKFYPEFTKPKLNKINIKYDDALEKINVKEICDTIIQLNKELLKNKMIISTESELSYNINDIFFYAKDFEYNIKNASLEFGIELALKNKCEFTHYEMMDFFKTKDISFNEIKKDILKTIDLIKDPITFKDNPKDYILVFEPKALRSIIGTFVIQLLNLDSKMKKESFLTNTLFDKKINIYEDPFVDYSPYSCKLDFDFINTTKKYLVKYGKPINYITTLNDAFKYNKKPTGNAVSETITNLFFENGKITIDKLIAKYQKVIVIYQLIGTHTTNNKEGTLSLSATGVEYNKGKRIKALKDIKLNEKIQDLFKIVEISKETKWIGNYNLPYLLCKRTGDK